MTIPRKLALASLPVIVAVLGCSNGLTLPPEEGGNDGPATIGRGKVRERRNILPGQISGPPPPEPGIYADQCDDLETGGPIRGPDCVTDVLRCGEQVVGHTIGGVNRYDTKFYEKKFCTPATTDHDGGDERVYRLDMPDGDWTAVVTLDTPCADLDLAAVLFNDDSCPSMAHNITRCEMWPKNGTARESVRLVTQSETSWYVIVEGKGDDAEGAFSLSVQCWRGLM